MTPVHQHLRQQLHTLCYEHCPLIITLTKLDNVYDAVNHDSYCNSFDQFTWQMQNSAKWLRILKPNQSPWATSPPAGSYHLYQPSSTITIITFSKEGYVFTAVCVCVSTKYLKKSWMDFDAFFGRMGHDSGTNQLDFGGNLDHGPDPRFLHPNHDPLFTAEINPRSVGAQMLTLLLMREHYYCVYLTLSVYAVSVDVVTHAVDLHKTASR